MFQSEDVGAALYEVLYKYVCTYMSFTFAQNAYSPQPNPAWLKPKPKSLRSFSTIIQVIPQC